MTTLYHFCRDWNNRAQGAPPVASQIEVLRETPKFYIVDLSTYQGPPPPYQPFIATHPRVPRVPRGEFQTSRQGALAAFLVDEYHERRRLERDLKLCADRVHWAEATLAKEASQ